LECTRTVLTGAKGQLFGPGTDTLEGKVLCRLLRLKGKVGVQIDMCICVSVCVCAILASAVRFTLEAFYTAAECSI